MTPDEFQISLIINDDDSVYRQAHVSRLIKTESSKKRRHPSESHFKPDPDGLSVHWNKHITVSGVFHIIGLSYKIGKGEYKDFKCFEVFSIPVEYIRSLEGVQAVVHSPVFNGDPAPIGSPNNYAHTSLIYPDDEEIRLKLSDYCQFDYDNSYCPADFTILDEEINELRKRLNDTIYHKLN